jgi:hypothetical protein
MRGTGYSSAADEIEHGYAPLEASRQKARCRCCCKGAPTSVDTRVSTSLQPCPQRASGWMDVGGIGVWAPLRFLPSTDGMRQ